MSGLVVDNVSKGYGAVHVLRGVSFSAAPGDSLAIVGPSGSGKSTLLNIIGSLEKPDSGAVRLGETDVTALAGQDVAAFRARRVGFVFQEHHLLPQLTAAENVMLPMLATGGADPKRASELLEGFGVAHRAGAFPAKMSGGERQRVALARALSNGPELLLCDEPTGNLDRDTGSTVVSLLLELGVTVVMVTHNQEHAGRFPRCLQLSDGLLVER
jgi:ABC-type lipoprotein export system ATPase subunit